MHVQRPPRKTVPHPLWGGQLSYHHLYLSLLPFSPLLSSFVQLNAFMERPPRMTHARCGCLSAHRASPVFPITWPVRLISSWPFLIPQRALSLETADLAAPHRQTRPSSCYSPSSSQSQGRWRMEDGGGAKRGKDKGSLIWIGNERAGSPPVFLPAEQRLLLHRRPITTCMAQPSTSYLLLKLGTNRWVSSKRGHRVA